MRRSVREGEVEIADHNIAMAKPMQTPDGMRKSKKVEIEKYTYRGVVERWSRTEAPKTDLPSFRS